MSDDPYCYQGTDVLRNKLDIREEEKLARLERLESANRMETLPDNIPINAAGYREIHRHIFCNIYDWAGQDRTVTSIKDATRFCNPKFIDTELNKQFAALNAEGNLCGLDADRFASRAAEYISELNVIHPFREGNGRTQRCFLANLAAQAGHRIDLARIHPEAWNEASIKSFFSLNYRPMRDVIAQALVDRTRDADRQGPDEQERSGSSEYVPESLPTADKDAEYLEAQITAGEMSDDRQRAVNRVLNQMESRRASSTNATQGQTRPGGAGGRSRGR